MSAAQESHSSKPVKNKFMDCFSCRVISGVGLIVSSAYVLYGARKWVISRGGPTMATSVHVTFAVSLLAMGTVILVDPVGKMVKKS